MCKGSQVHVLKEIPQKDLFLTELLIPLEHSLLTKLSTQGIENYVKRGFSTKVRCECGRHLLKSKWVLETIKTKTVRKVKTVRVSHTTIEQQIWTEENNSNSGS